MLTYPSYIKNIREAFRKIKLNINYLNYKIHSNQGGNDLIAHWLNIDTPFAVGRLGATEMHCVIAYLKNKKYSSYVFERGCLHAGIFPPNSESFDEFCEVYLNSLHKLDALCLVGCVGEKKVVENYCAKAQLISMRAIEPYYYGNPWSSCLRGKKLLIVHPFVDTIKKQYINRDKLFKNDAILPEIKNIQYFKAVQSAAGETTNFLSWKLAYIYMCDAISRLDFDVAIIGAGAYSLPLAAFIKTMGKQGIQMSGATQILFGIKGRRWDDHPYISKLYNDYWVRPAPSEIPSNFTKLEGGSYW